MSVMVGGGRKPVHILRDIGLDIRAGEFISIIGASGTGKTTLLRALGGLQPVHDPATLTYLGHPIERPPSDVAFVFQNYIASLLSWRTVARNVALGVEGLLSRAECAERVAEALEMVGLAHRKDDYPRQLSGGMQQRVQIARALAMRPKVLLMDEPFGALDAMTKQQLQDEMQRLHQLSGATVVFVTHDTEEAVYLSDRIVALTGSPASIGREIVVDIPRPREQMATRELPRYLELRRLTHDAIHAGYPGNGRSTTDSAAAGHAAVRGAGTGAPG
jgi:NitT/TauT family transport system ATP-binding protein